MNGLPTCIMCGSTNNQIVDSICMKCGSKIIIQVYEQAKTANNKLAIPVKYKSVLTEKKLSGYKLSSGFRIRGKEF